jgi:hypothetical protein
MKFRHPDNTHDIIAVPGTELLGDVDHDSGWVAIGYLSEARNVLVHRNEWLAFKALVAEIDEALK